MIPGAQLVVCDAGIGVGKIAVELARLEAEHIAGGGVVAAEAIQRAGIKPLLGAAAGGGGDENIFRQRVGDEVGVGVVRAPFVGDAIDGVVGVADYETGFEPAQHVGVRVVHGQGKMFYEHRAAGESPFTRRGKVDGGAGRNGDPALLDRAIRPQRRVDGVGEQVGAGREGREIRERAGLREQRRKRLACRWRPGAGEFKYLPADAAHLAKI